MIEVLLKYGASIDKPMSAAYNRITALIMATQAGNMDLVKYLISRRAKLERPGKYHCTVVSGIQYIMIYCDITLTLYAVSAYISINARWLMKM